MKYLFIGLVLLFSIFLINLSLLKIKNIEYEQKINKEYSVLVFNEDGIILDNEFIKNENITFKKSKKRYFEVYVPIKWDIQNIFGKNALSFCKESYTKKPENKYIIYIKDND